MNVKLISQIAVGVILIGFMAFGMLYKATPHRVDSNPEKIIKNFELVNHNGQKFHFDDLKGEYKFVYFGFAFCPDICPASLNKISNSLVLLNKYSYKNFKALFISIDPKRDTPGFLKNYVAHFHKDIIGATGDEESLKAIAEDFGAYYAIVPNEKDPEDYMVNHTSFVYLIGKNNEYITHFHLETKPEEIVEFVRKNKLQ